MSGKKESYAFTGKMINELVNGFSVRTEGWVVVNIPMIDDHMSKKKGGTTNVSICIINFNQMETFDWNSS